MKKAVKSLFLSLCLAFLCMIAVPSVSQAASLKPAQVKNLRASVSESTVILRWNRVSNASGYRIYCLDPETNTYTKVAYTTSAGATTKKLTKLTNNTEYTFCVSAYRKVKSTKYEGGQSKPVSATPKVKKPSVPSLQLKSCGNQKVSLKWNKISGASFYEVYQQNAAGKYLSIGTTKNTSVTVKKLTNGTNYLFKVRAVRKVGGVSRKSSYSASVTGKPQKISEEVSSIRSIYYTAKIVETVRAKKIDAAGYVTLTAGTTVTVIKRSSYQCSASLKNGTMVTVYAPNLEWVAAKYSSKTDYSKSTKESYVNYKGYTSNTKYLMWISLYRQRVYIFKGSQCNWKLFKTYLCSSGKAATSTPKGKYTLWKKAPIMRFDEYSYGNLACYFSGNALHSWVYTNDGNRYNDGVLGKPASHGCVRLGDAQIKYVYEKIPLGTTIIIY